MKLAEEKKTRAGRRRPGRTSEDPAVRIVELLDEVGEKLRTDEFKPTVADFIRLLQIHKEFYATRPRKLEVTWIDPPPLRQYDAA